MIDPIDHSHKQKIAFRMIVSFCIALVICYAIKMFGGNFFQYVATNKNLIAISNYIDSNLWANFIGYGILNIILVYFATFAVCERFTSKWWVDVIICVFAFVISILRYYFNNLSFLFDFLQYIICPCIVGIFVFKKNALVTVFDSIRLYFIIIGILYLTVLLNDMFIEVATYGFLLDVLSMIEMYIFVILFYLEINYRRLKNEPSN